MSTQAAVEFVSNIDNFAYTLATTGFLGSTIKRKTDRVKKVSFKRDRSFWRGFFIQFTFILNLLALLAVWWWTRMRQLQGHYLQAEACGSVMVDFGSEVFDLSTRLDETGGEDFPPLLHYSYFSGEYVADIDNKLSKHRPVYYERGNKDDPRAGLVGLSYYN